MKKKKASLNELNLRCNKLTPTGVAAIAAALKLRSAPCFVDLNVHHLRDQMLDELDEELASGKSIDNDAESKCSVHYESGLPEIRGETDRFKHQRHALISRLLFFFFKQKTAYEITV